jgi:hypothetical protein
VGVVVGSREEREDSRGSAIVAGPFRRFGFAVFASTGDLSDLQSSAKRHTTIVNLGKVRSAHHQVQYLYCSCRMK